MVTISSVLFFYNKFIYSSLPGYLGKLFLEHRVYKFVCVCVGRGVSINVCVCVFTELTHPLSAYLHKLRENIKALVKLRWRESKTVY